MGALVVLSVTVLPSRDPRASVVPSPSVLFVLAGPGSPVSPRRSSWERPLSGPLQECSWRPLVCASTCSDPAADARSRKHTHVDPTPLVGESAHFFPPCLPQPILLLTLFLPCVPSVGFHVAKPATSVPLSALSLLLFFLHPVLACGLWPTVQFPCDHRRRSSVRSFGRSTST